MLFPVAKLRPDRYHIRRGTSPNTPPPPPLNLYHMVCFIHSYRVEINVWVIVCNSAMVLNAQQYLHLDRLASGKDSLFRWMLRSSEMRKNIKSFNANS